MTRNAKFKRAVRDRMAQTGEKYTKASRAVAERRPEARVASPDTFSEPHYAFIPPRTIEFVDEAGRRSLPVPEEAGPSFSWGYAGTGPNTSAWAVLLDATGSCDRRLAIAFTDDNLNWWEEIGGKAFVITKREVVEWRRLNESKVRERAEEGFGISRFSDMLDRIREYDEALATFGPRKPFWQAYRAAQRGG